jgi:hypothetical protein
MMVQRPAHDQVPVFDGAVKEWKLLVAAIGRCASAAEASAAIGSLAHLLKSLSRELLEDVVSLRPDIDSDELLNVVTAMVEEAAVLKRSATVVDKRSSALEEPRYPGEQPRDAAVSAGAGGSAHWRAGRMSTHRRTGASCGSAVLPEFGLPAILPPRSSKGG